MSLTSIFKSIFGSGDASGAKKASSKQAADPVEYNGFSIYAEPMNEGGQFRTAGRICKELDGEERQTKFIRADNNSDHQAAVEHALYKAKQIIDEQGDAIFKREMV